MALYEGLSAEKLAVVLDIGARYTKFGFVGEFSPRCIIPTEIYCTRTEKIRKVFDYENDQDLYALLVAFIHKLYFRHVLVSPKDRHVVVVESLLCPTQFRDTLASVFYRHYEVASILFVPSQLVTLCALGVRSALVVDVGFTEAQVIPVFEGVPILNAWEAQPLAGHAIEKRIRENLDKVYMDLMNAGGDTVPPEGATDIINLSESVIEDIKVRGCFVTTRKRGERLSEGVLTPEPPVLEYRLGGDKMIKVPGWVRESSCEVMFEKDNEEASLPNLILDSILKCPIDTRKGLAENIVLVGGTVMAPGFKARLMEELKAHLRSPVYENRLAITAFKFHTPPAKDNYTCWLGGAIFGATDMIQMRGLSRENYLSLKTVPDWSNLATNILSLTRLSIS
uniref:Actin-related protein 10 n=2 Tax=Lygus hesperus TaxID=30085 RepID=A0A0A9YD65_LYGHE